MTIPYPRRKLMQMRQVEQRWSGKRKEWVNIGNWEEIAELGLYKGVFVLEMVAMVQYPEAVREIKWYSPTDNKEACSP